MKKNQTSRALFGLLILVWGLLLPSQGHATQVQHVETHGSIGFTGVYDPIGAPEPSPPDTIARPPSLGHPKPGGRLPQTNDQSQYWLIWLGVGFLLLVVLIVYRRTKQEE